MAEEVESNRVLVSSNLVRIKVVCKNTVYIKVNKLIIPTTSDQIITVMYPVANLEETIRIKGIGVLKRSQFKLEVFNYKTERNEFSQPILVKEILGNSLEVGQPEIANVTPDFQIVIKGLELSKNEKLEVTPFIKIKKDLATD